MDKKKLFIITASVFGLLVVSVILMGMYIHKLNCKLDVSENNYEAAKEKAESVMLENGSLLTEKKAFILSEEKMREEMEMTKKEMKDLNKKLSAQSVYISKLESSVRIDTVNTVRDSIIYVDNTPKAVLFKYSDPWLAFSGKTDLERKKTTLFDITAPIPLTVGMTENYTIYAISENPHFKIGEVHAAALDKFVKETRKPKRWGFGLYAGLGVQYGIIERKFDFGPQAGVGFTYRF